MAVTTVRVAYFSMEPVLNGAVFNSQRMDWQYLHNAYRV
jgi:hypothetical protein